MPQENRCVPFVIFCFIALIYTAGFCYNCPQIPADCFGWQCQGKERYSTYFMCNNDPDDLTCLQGAGYVLLGKMNAHPDDNSGHLIHNNPGNVGLFRVDDVVLSNMPEDSTPSPGDLIEVAWGGGCYGWYQPDSLTKIVLFYRDDQSIGDDTLQCNYLPKCGAFVLDYNNGVVSGYITDSIRSMDYEEFKSAVRIRTATKIPVSRVRPGLGKVPFTATMHGRSLILSVNEYGSALHGMLTVCSLDGRKRFVAPVHAPPGSIVTFDAQSWTVPGVMVLKINGWAALLMVKRL